MEPLFSKTIDSPIGPLTLQGNETGLVAILFSKTKQGGTGFIPPIIQQTEETANGLFFW